MNNKQDYLTLIQEVVGHPNYQPLKLREIAKKLGMLDEEKQLKRAVKKLIKQNLIEYGAKHRLSWLGPAPQQDPNQAKSTDSAVGLKSKKTDELATSNQKSSASPDDLTGTFRRNIAGFGFFTPHDSTAIDRSDDIFIPQSQTLDAADKDTVRVRLSSGSRGSRNAGRKQEGKAGRSNRPTAQIVEVIQRHTNRFVGTYSEAAEQGFVMVDGGVFESGIFVGDAAAKNCRIGDKVVIEMVHFPSARNDGEGVVVEVLGDRGTPGVDTISIIRQFDLPDDFPESVLENARQQAAQFNDSKIPPHRTDFTQQTVITIDPATARDFDDAISLERLDNGHWLLAVHIADVSHFVPLDSKLDLEAFDRGTSVYLPDRVLPMLPEVISNNLASLQPGRLRYCMTASIEFTEEGVPVHTELHRGVIKSAHRFTYEEIDDYLENPTPWKKKLSPDVFRLVGEMHTLAMRLRKRRLDRGAINLVLPEVRIKLDDNGKVAGGYTEENTESHQIIEEFMLAANIATAQFLVDRDLPLVRRVHPQPTEAKMNDLSEFVRGLGIQVDNLQDRFELKRVIEQSEGLPEQHAIHYAVLRSMQKAVYSPQDIGHYALNAKIYCHFTSPIRRYPDLVIHRMVGDVIDGKKPDASVKRLTAVGQHCSDREKRATEAERELVKLKLLNYMADQLGTRLHAVITGVESFGIFAQGIEIPAEGLVPLANLPPDSYRYDRQVRLLSGHRQENQFRLGDSIEVQVTLVDPDRRLLEYRLLKRVDEDRLSQKPRGRKQEKGPQRGTQRRTQKPRSTTATSKALSRPVVETKTTNKKSPHKKSVAPKKSDHVTSARASSSTANRKKTGIKKSAKSAPAAKSVPGTEQRAIKKPKRSTRPSTGRTPSANKKRRKN